MGPHLNPSEVRDRYWIYAFDNIQAGKYPNQDGKWMMFFPMAEMDERWIEASNLYYSGKLTGIHSIKASTIRQNPMLGRLHDKDEGIIIFYCGKSEDEEIVKNYGENILIRMSYPSSHFYYKSDKPHLIIDKNIKKHLYSINTQKFYHTRVFTALRQLEKNYNFFFFQI